MSEPAERPNVVPWPPVLFVGCLLGAALMTRLFPMAFLSTSGFVSLAGWALVAVALGLMGWSFMTFQASSTTILPHRAASELIETGPFAFSRNPIYLAELLLLIGLGLTEQPLWWLIAAWLFRRLIVPLAIEREEAHLKARFGDAWESYASRVRRWA